MRIVCVIPARIGSTRLSEKPLRLLAGEPLVRRVADRVRDFGLADEIVVATDDARVAQAVVPAGFRAILTDPRHRSGTERVAELAALPEFAMADVLLNVQGDEPFLPREAAAGALERLRAGDDVGTAAHPLLPQAATNPNRVKVAVDVSGCARRFFRTAADKPMTSTTAVWEHIGVYAYTPATVRTWVALEPVPEEHSAGLEQVRPLAHGMRIGVARLADTASHGIDTEEDLRLAEASW